MAKQPNPFLDPHPVSELSQLYGREELLEQLYSFVASPKPRSCALTGMPRIGKSSMLRCLPQFVNTRAGRGAHSPLVVYVNLQNSLADDYGEFLAFVYRTAIEQAKANNMFIENLPDELDPAGSSMRLKDTFTKLFTMLDTPLVLLFDEFEILLTRPPLAATLLDYLRSLIEDQKIPFGCVIATRKPLHRIYPKHEASPLSNVLVKLPPLSPLAPEAARKYIADHWASPPVISNEEVDDLLDFVGYAPDYVREGAAVLFEAIGSGERIRKSDLHARITRALEPTSSEIWQFMTQEQQSGALKLVSSNVPPTSLELDELDTGGLLEHDVADQARLFSKAFAHYVARKAGMDAPIGELVQMIDKHRTIIIRGQSIALSDREFALFGYLYQHRGEVCSRAELCTAVWGDEPVGDEALQVLVSRLRKTIMDVAGNAISITTVRLSGYRLDVNAETVEGEFTFPAQFTG